jgi:predicted aconitase with swiveling domain
MNEESKLALNKKVYQGNIIISGKAEGKAMVTKEPINFTAAFTKISNMLPGKSAEIMDRHHDLFGNNIHNRVLFFPSCIGSTHTGLVLLDLVRMERGPAALVVQKADPILISGIILSEVWYGPKIPIVEYDDADLFEMISNGDEVLVDQGKVQILNL